MAAISADSISVRLGEREILKEVSLSVSEGTWLGVIGPNGAGKTTLIKAMSGLLEHSGQIHIQGRSLADWSDRERARMLAIVAQSVPLYFDFTAMDLVMLGRAPHKNWLAPYNQDDRERAAQALAAVDLKGFEQRSVLTLSGGELRRVLLAQALCQDTPILILDEPTSHLDVHHQFDFLEQVRALVDSGRTAVGVFHDLELASRFSDAICVLEDGRVRAMGSPADTLTPELIKDVFRMQASVRPGNGRLHIDYSASI